RKRRQLALYSWRYTSYCPQALRIAHDEDRRERHRACSKHGRQEDVEGGIENACGDRDQESIVAKGPEEVLPDVLHRGSTEREGVDHALEVAAEQDDIGTLDCRIRA